MSALEILVRGPNWTGDLVMATPGFRALRAGFPEANITLHVPAKLAPLLAGAPWFDAVVPLASRESGRRALVREGLALRRRARFDLGLCLPDSIESALLMRLAGVRRIVGYARGLRGRPLSQRVSTALRGRALDLCGTLGLGALKGLLRRARLLVANDAGARHVAVALGVPCVLVMGPTSLDKTPLNLERVSVLSADVACRPCYLRDCPIDHRCMRRVAPEWVAREALRAWGAPARFSGVQRQIGRLAA